MLRRHLVAGPVLLSLAPGAVRAEENASDWPNLRRYAEMNTQDAQRPHAQRRAVFLGDSITDAWATDEIGSGFMPSHGFLGRGISGQTTSQMLLRFYPDVIALRPAAVHILAGINDIAGNTGPYWFEATKNNLEAMTVLAHAARIKVIMGSVLPAASIPWRPDLGSPIGRVNELNEWIARHCVRHRFVFANYWSAMADNDGGLRAAFAADPVHPNAAGYRAMEPIALDSIRRSL